MENERIEREDERCKRKDQRNRIKNKEEGRQPGDRYAVALAVKTAVSKGPAEKVKVYYNDGSPGAAIVV